MIHGPANSALNGREVCGFFSQFVDSQSYVLIRKLCGEILSPLTPTLTNTTINFYFITAISHKVVCVPGILIYLLGVYMYT